MGPNTLKATGEFSLILPDRVDLNKCHMQNSFTHQAPVTAKIQLIWEKIVQTFLSCFQQTELYPTPYEHLPKGKLSILAGCNNVYIHNIYAPLLKSCPNDKIENKILF